MITGNVRTMSQARLMTRSIQRRWYPAARPRSDPRIVAPSTATGATASTVRAPHRMRERRSRPRWSVPSQWARDGVGLARAAMLLALGGYGAISGASRAARTHTRMMASPITAGCDSPTRARRPAQTPRRPARSERRGARVASVAAGIAMGAASAPDPRVQRHVGEVARDLGQDGHGHGHERADLDDGDVLEQRRLQHHPPEAGI